MNERRRFWGRKVFWFDITKRMSKKIYWFKLPLCKRPILQFTVCFFVGLFELQSELLQLHSFRSWYDSVLKISFLFYIFLVLMRQSRIQNKQRRLKQRVKRLTLTQFCIVETKLASFQIWLHLTCNRYLYKYVFSFQHRHSDNGITIIIILREVVCLISLISIEMKIVPLSKWHNCSKYIPTKNSLDN